MYATFARSWRSSFAARQLVALSSLLAPCLASLSGKLSLWEASLICSTLWTLCASGAFGSSAS